MQGHSSWSSQGVECGTWGEVDPLPFQENLEKWQFPETQLSFPSPMIGPGSGQAGFSSCRDSKRNARGHSDLARRAPPFLGSLLCEVTEASCHRGGQT